MPYVVKLSMTGPPEQSEAACEILYAKTQQSGLGFATYHAKHEMRRQSGCFLASEHLVMLS